VRFALRPDAAKLEAKLAKFQLDRQKLEQDLLETKEEEEVSPSVPHDGVRAGAA
jgi:hypothetical protein